MRMADGKGGGETRGWSGGGRVNNGTGDGREWKKGHGNGG